MAPFSLVYDTNMAAFSLVYDTNMATVTSLETLYGLVIVSLDCMLVPVRCGKKKREMLSSSFYWFSLHVPVY